MGQKVNPIGLRLNITRSWESVWYADKGYAANLNEDQRVRAYLKKRLYHAGISQIMVERTGDILAPTPFRLHKNLFQLKFPYQ